MILTDIEQRRLEKFEPPKREFGRPADYVIIALLVVSIVLGVLGL